MQHIEFFHKDHFELNYHRKKPKKLLSHFIDYFWETKFEEVFEEYPEGFSDALFPNIGYTFLINLGSPFVMQLGIDKFQLKSDGFLPRHKSMICHHAKGNKIFGIKFKVSPVILQKKIDFSEYKEFIFPLAYLIDKKIILQIKEAASFDGRVAIVSKYYEQILVQHAEKIARVNIITDLLQKCVTNKNFDLSIEEIAAEYGISARTLQRYFEAATSISSKQALQLLRIRSATVQLADHPKKFSYTEFGYYDNSHFQKHLKSFLSHPGIALANPHLILLNKIK